MALPKLFQRIIWHNNTTPAIQEDNLNAMSKGLSDVDDRVISLAGTIMEDVPQIQEDIADLQEAEATFNAAIQSAQDAATNAQNSANAAAGSVTSAQQKALIAEGWAKGTQNGSPVSQSSPYWENNAEYWAGKARSFTPEGYQDLVDDVDSLKETFTKNGAHNLLPLTLVKLKALNTGGTWSGNTYTWRGLTFEVNTDASGNVTSITANGTPSTSQVQFFITNHAGLENGEYILNGALSSSKRIFFYNGSQWFDDLGSGINFSVSGSETAQQVIITILEAVNNDVFYPMIKLASDPDSTFTPYAMTNRELTQAKLDVTQLKTVVAASSDFADFKTRIAAL